MEVYPFISPAGDVPIYFIAETDSTMADARSLVESGASSGVVVLTDFQRRGRGRVAGRQWVSPSGESLMFTAALKTSTTPDAMPVKVGVAVARALEALHGLSPAIKWPNDVLVNGRKIGGILCEYSAPWLFIGVGLNLFQQSFSPEIADSATSVALESAIQDELARRDVRDALLSMILREIRDGVLGWRDYANQRLWCKDRLSVVVLPDGDRLEGVVRGVNTDGTLAMERGGARLSLAAGEIESYPISEAGA